MTCVNDDALAKKKILKRAGMQIVHDKIMLVDGARKRVQNRSHRYDNFLKGIACRSITSKGAMLIAYTFEFHLFFSTCSSNNLAKEYKTSHRFARKIIDVLSFNLYKLLGTPGLQDVWERWELLPHIHL